MRFGAISGTAPRARPDSREWRVVSGGWWVTTHVTHHPPLTTHDCTWSASCFFAASKPCSWHILSAEAAMKWSDEGRSSNIEDRRGSGVGRMGMGIGGTAVLLVLSLLFGRNFF